MGRDQPRAGVLPAVAPPGCLLASEGSAQGDHADIGSVPVLVMIKAPFGPCLALRFTLVALHPDELLIKEKQARRNRVVWLHHLPRDRLCSCEPQAGAMVERVIVGIGTDKRAPDALCYRGRTGVFADSRVSEDGMYPQAAPGSAADALGRLEDPELRDRFLD